MELAPRRQPTWANVRIRRISPVAECPDQGPLTEPAADARLRDGNYSSCPEADLRRLGSAGSPLAVRLRNSSMLRPRDRPYTRGGLVLVVMKSGVDGLRTRRTALRPLGRPMHRSTGGSGEIRGVPQMNPSALFITRPVAT